MVQRHFFISYSTAEALDFAIQLHDELEGGYPKYEAWLDKRDLRPAEDWDTQIDNAIRDCGALLFVMTPDSVMDNSVCKLEWSRALSYKKSVIPIYLQESNLPFRLGNRQYINFSDFKKGIAELRKYLEWVNSPAGELQRMQDELLDMQRQLIRTAEDEKPRIEKAMSDLQARIKEQQFVVDHPAEAAERTEASVTAAIERARQPADKPKSGTKFINHPPATVPNYFQDRVDETRILAQFLGDERYRIFHLIGRAGIGKTAVTVRLLKHLEAGKLPDDNGDMSVDGIVYLSQVGARDLKVAHLYPDLCRLLPDDVAASLDALYREPMTSTADKMKALLGNFPPDKRILVLLDNFEDVVDAETQAINDSELDEALKAILDAPPHGIKVLITTRVLANQLYLYQSQGQRRQVIGEGLVSPFAEEMLRQMDDGTLNLKDAPLEKLSGAADRVRRFPRALEALVGWLEADFSASLDEVLNFADDILPDNVVQVLVARAFNRLDRVAQQVIQALAILGRPVSSGAVDAIMKPYVAGINSAPVLRRLLNWHFVRQEGGLFNLHPVDRAYALSLIPRGEDSDRFEAGSPPFTQIALYALAANYYQTLWKPREEWKTIADLEPQLAEFDMRCLAGDWDTAADVLLLFDFDYLLRWGHYKVMIELHERMLGKIKDQWLKADSVGNLGSAYYKLGDAQKAIIYYEDALALVQASNYQRGKEIWLTNLGNAYGAVGNTNRSIEYYQQALTVSRESNNIEGEIKALGNLGNAYRDLGEISKAISFHQQALTISREYYYRDGENTAYGNLGDVYRASGDNRKAFEYYQQALTIAHSIADEHSKGIWLGKLANGYSVMRKFDKAISLHQQALDIARELGTKDREGLALSYLGYVYNDRGDYETAIDYHRKALVIAREIEDKASEGRHLGDLGTVYLNQTIFDTAIDFYRQALDIAISIDDKWNEQIWLSNLGKVHTDQGDYETAIDYHQKTLVIAQEMEDKVGEGVELRNLGNCYEKLGEHEIAINYYEQAVVIAREIGNKLAENAQLGNIGNAYSAMGKKETAIEYYLQALSVAREIEDNENQIVWLGNIGLVYSDLGEHKTAIEYYQQAFNSAKIIEDKSRQCLHLGDIAFTYGVMGEQQTAIEYYQQALSIAREIGDVPNQIIWLGNVGLAYNDLKEYQTAIDYYQQAFDLANTAENRSEQAVQLGNIAFTYGTMDEHKTAIDYYQQALSIAREVGDNENQIIWLGNIGIAYSDLDEHKTAIDYYQQAFDTAKTIENKSKQSIHLSDIAFAYSKLGEHHRAIEYYQQALSIAREIEDRMREIISLGNIGFAYSDLYEYKNAIEYYQQALSIAHEIEDRSEQALQFANIAYTYGELGEVNKTIEHYQQAIALVREEGNQDEEARYLGNLGIAFVDLGDTAKATELYQQALTIAREIESKIGESLQQENLGHISMDKSDWQEAEQYFRDAITIADEHNVLQAQHEARWSLALMYLYQTNLSLAQKNIDEALSYDFSQNSHDTYVVQSVIALRQGDQAAARVAFNQVFQMCETALVKTPDLYRVNDAKALALCGSALLDNDASKVEEAKAAFHSARSTTKDLKGHIGRTQRLFDALAVMDTAGLLAGVREAIAGE